ncbi:AI-2E family transporter [Ovoidimarina sediminis]|uniref:AI-2E family transporter n=1 Tax=Ovoidimarina sediminis TaxID=3079856 RepID=UPI002910114A|nr:AI-2E family transporter [Rhodophyticola sp. MJ-SS7]MDU8944647.1 AI-2E family transporter [Rhodophyticola sp. MJ-SS7]
MTQKSVQTSCLTLLTLIAVFATMNFAEGLFAPMLAAIVLGIVCAPVTDRVERMGLPRVVAALMVLALFIVSFLALFFLVEPIISKAIRNAPLIWYELTEILEAVSGAASGMREIQETVSEALTPEVAEGEETVTEEPVAFPGIMDALAYAPSLAAGIMVFVGTLYFFLVARTDVYDRAHRANGRLTREVLCRAESRVSRYFVTITGINAAFGCLVGAVMTVIGMSNPMLWGLAAFLVNFVLYLGPAGFAASLLLAGIVQFDGAMSFVPAAVYVAMNMIEGQFVTPSLVGQHMRVNPLMVFISLIFWLWLWGPLGGVVAIPVLVWCLVVFEQLADPPPTGIELDDGEQARRQLAV